MLNVGLRGLHLECTDIETCHYIQQWLCWPQVHLGYFLSEQVAAKAYDRAAIIKGGPNSLAAAANFDFVSYTKELEVLQALDQDAFVAALADEA